MITSQQKRILRDMEYTEGEIKSLKPLEALLIVENGISGQEEDWREKVSEMVREETLNESEDDETQVGAEGEISNDHVESTLGESSDISSKHDKINTSDGKENQLPLAGANYKASASSKVARVAFMITSQQKRVLRDMEYTEGEIKSLKPLEALLIVENGISGQEEDWREKVSEMVREEMLNESEDDESRVGAEREISNDDVESTLGESSDISSKHDKTDTRDRKPSQVLLVGDGKDQIKKKSQDHPFL